jgi:hypothetical protein
MWVAISVVSPDFYPALNAVKYREAAVENILCLQENLNAKDVLAIGALSDMCDEHRCGDQLCALLIHCWNSVSAHTSTSKLPVQAAVCRALGRRKALSEATLKFVRQQVVRPSLEKSTFVKRTVKL